MNRVYKWIVDRLEFSSLQKAKQFCRENKTSATGIYGADRNGNNVTFTPIEIQSAVSLLESPIK